MDSVTEPVKSIDIALHAASLQDQFDQYAGTDHAVDYRDLQLILNHAFSHGMTSVSHRPWFLHNCVCIYCG